jgi:hypothetical protein
MLGTDGHVLEYLFRYKNLYRHSQQGWEAMNNLLKTYYYRQTGQGGGKYERSKLKSIGRWLQQRTLWLCGWDEQRMRDHINAPATNKVEEETEEQQTNVLETIRLDGSVSEPFEYMDDDVLDMSTMVSL